jgi:ketosteroid isomerase-like protein
MADAAADKDQIIKLIHGIFEAFANHQSGEIESTLHPDATVWDVFVPDFIRGTAERQKFHEADQKQMQARGALAWSVEMADVRVWDDSAIACYYLSFTYQPPNATAGRVRITDVFRRLDGKWRVIHHHEGMVPTGVPPINETKTA